MSGLLLSCARLIAAKLPGAAAPNPAEAGFGPTDSELEVDDANLKWPRDTSRLPDEWRKLALGKQRPYAINHTRGSLRLKHAAMWIGLALSTCLAIWLVTTYLSSQSPSARAPFRALGFDKVFGAGVARDLLRGGLAGSVPVACIFLSQWALGWIVPVGVIEERSHIRALAILGHLPY